MLRALKHRLRAMVPPLIFLGITWYFGWNAVHGTRGLQAQRAQTAELAQAQTAFTAVDAERRLWEAKTGALSGASVAPDMLDDEARLVLNLADPADLVVKLPAGTDSNK